MKSLAENNVSEMAYFVSYGAWNLHSVNQAVVVVPSLRCQCPWKRLRMHSLAVCWWWREVVLEGRRTRNYLETYLLHLRWLQIMSQNRATSNFGSIWAVGLTVCPPICLPSLACTRVPRKPCPRRPSCLFRPAASCLPPLPAARNRPSIQATPRGQRDSLIIYRFPNIVAGFKEFHLQSWGERNHVITFTYHVASMNCTMST